MDAGASGASLSQPCGEAFDRAWDLSWSRNPVSVRNLIAMREIQALIEENEYDIIHVHTPVAGFVTRMSPRSRRRRTRVVDTAHGFHFFEGGKALRNAAFRSAERIAGRWTDRLVVINREDEKAAIENNIVDSSQPRHMPGIGVDLAHHRGSDLAAGAAQVRRDLGVEDAPLFLRPLNSFHGNGTLICSALLHQCATERLISELCGNGPLLEDMRQLACELEVGERIHFLGFRPYMPALFAAANAAVLVSDQEGLPRSVMEAMAVSRPVIGSNIRGTRDLLENGAGMLVPVGDIEQIASALDWIVEHPSEAKSMGMRATEAAKKYDIRRILSMHDSLYNELL